MLQRFLWLGTCLALCSLVPQSPMATARAEKPDPLAVVKRQPTLVAQLGHSDVVSSVALSSDGKWLVTGSLDKTARLWEFATGKEVRTFQGHAGEVTAVALAPDGTWLVTGSSDGATRVWAVATAQVLHTLRGHSGGVTAVALSRDGKWLVTGSLDTTARLWEVATGEEVRTFRGHSGRINSVSLSGDGKWLATGSGDYVKGVDYSARLWDVATGKEVRTIPHLGVVLAVSFSNKGDRLVSGSVDKTARIWDLATGRLVRAFPEHPFAVNAVRLSADGARLVTSNSDDHVRLWDVATGKLVRSFFVSKASAVWLSGDGKWLVAAGQETTLREVATGKLVRVFGGYAAEVTALSLSGDGKSLVVGGWSTTACAWDAATGQKVRAFKHPDGNTLSAGSLSADGKWLVTFQQETARLWEVATGKEVRAFEGHRSWLHSVSLSADGKWLLTCSGDFLGSRDGDNTARLWEVATGKELRSFRGHSGGVRTVSLSGDSKWLATGSDDNTARLWEVATGKQLRVFRHSPGIACACLSRDGKWLVIGSGDKTARLWEVATGKEVRVFRGHADGVVTLTFSGDGKWLLTGSADGTARLWEAATGKELRVFRGHSGSVTSASLSADGKWLFTGSDHTARLWGVTDGKELCRLISFRDGSWAVIDRAGRYDASGAGDVQGLHWVIGNEPIALTQLKERYYDPGLLAKHLGLNKSEPLRDVAPFRDVKLFPTAEATPPAPGSTKLTVRLTNRGGGLGKVQVFVNGRELLADARGPRLDPTAANAELTVDLAGAHLKPGEPNKVSVVTWNAEGYLSSRDLDLSFVPVGKPDERPPELYAIVAGVSKYAADKLNLRFAAKDAQDMAGALRAGARRLFGADKVHLTLLCDGGQPEALPPTRANLEKAFAAVRKSRPGDVLVVYLAGHGVAFPDAEQEVYCFLTKEARAVSRDAFRDPDIRRQSSITSTELTEWLKQTPALKQVLVLDTCAAGAAAGKLMEHRDVSADQIRAIDRLQNRTGFHVLMGCAADRVSYEASQYSQGVLTYALLQAMRGAKLREGTYIDVSQWFQYAADEVPLFARHVGGIQRPLVMAPRGTSFDIGQLLPEDRKAVPLAQVRPLLLRPVLLNADDLTDNLDLMPRLRKALADASHAGARGPGKAAGAVYVDADELPGAVRPSGTYTVKGDKVRVTLVLSRDGEASARLQVDGVRNDLQALAARLVAAVEERLHKQQAAQQGARRW